MLVFIDTITKFILLNGVDIMKREFDLNNLTDDEVKMIENSLEMRRISKMCCSEFEHLHIQRGLAAAMSAGFRPHEINATVAPNYGNDDRSVFVEFRQIGKSSMMSELFKPYLEFKLEEQIDEEHEQYSAVFNQFRRGKYLPSIELKIGNLYELKLGSREVYTKEMYLVRIDGNIKHSPELYFSLNNENSSGTNISVYKIVREIK